MADGSEERSRGLAVWPWVLYDFANTIFLISILSFFFPFWIGGEVVFNGATAVRALFFCVSVPETTVEEYAPLIQGERAL